MKSITSTNVCNLSSKNDSDNREQEKKIFHIVDVVVPTDNRMKRKEIGNMEKNPWTVVRELRKRGNMTLHIMTVPLRNATTTTKKTIKTRKISDSITN